MTTKVYTSRDIPSECKQGMKRVRVIVTTLLVGQFVWLAQVVTAASISESYPTQDNYPLGTLVSIKQTEPISVELAHINNNHYLTGVVVAQGESLLDINRANAQLQVATSGDVEVFVSDIGGDIGAGDFIGAGWIAGVAMKADEGSQRRLLGVALQDFSSDSPNKQVLTDIDTPSGKSQANIGKVVVRLFDSYSGADSSLNATGLEMLAQRVAGKNVSYAKVLMAAGIFTLSVIISGVFLANAIRGSFISLGRNPLASSSIFTSLMQISGVSIALVIIGSFLAYLVLLL